MGRADVAWILLEFQYRLFEDLRFALCKIPKGPVYVGEIRQGDPLESSFTS